VSAAGPGSPETASARTGRALEVLLVFARLGVTAFGGPLAHLGYFRDELVLRRRWLDEHAYADLVSLAQFLPGPTSSQVGFSLGLLRAGYVGGIAAWAGFTLPSAALLLLFASVAGLLDNPWGLALLHGLKLVAVSIVAQAVWGMARALCPDWPRALIAIAAGAMVLLVRSPAIQIAAILLAGLAGLGLRLPATSSATSGQLPALVSPRTGLAALALFGVLLAGLPLLRGLAPGGEIALFEAFYRSGALVFGGGHVVLPLLSESFVAPGWVSRDAFLAGYGAAQAIPGPLFTFAAYLGAIAGPAPHPLLGAAIGLSGIFLPGLLILMGVLPFWQTLRRSTAARSAMAGSNAATVGLLGAALGTPVWTGAVYGLGDAALAVAGFLLLVIWRAPPLVVLLLSAGGALALARL
jgi:chromate transporter